LSGFGLFHQFKLLVLDFENSVFAHFDFVGERLVFLVFLRLKLLE